MEGSLAWISEMKDDFSPPVHTDCDMNRCRDMFMEFIYIVVIPGGVVFLTAFACAIGLCCSRIKRNKSDAEDEIELDKYYTIRRASQSLRDLSHKRDTLLLSSGSGSFSFSNSERYRGGGRNTSHSAPTTLQRDRRRIRDDRSLSPSPYSEAVSEGRSITPPIYQYVADDRTPSSSLHPPYTSTPVVQDQKELLASRKQ